MGELIASEERGTITREEVLDIVESMMRRYEGGMPVIVERILNRPSLDLTGAGLAKKGEPLPYGSQLANVKLINPNRDDFDNALYLTGPFTGGMTGQTISADGILTFNCNGTAGAHYWSECGRLGGAFIPLNKNFTVETAISLLDNTNCGARGSIGVNDMDADGSHEWWVTATKIQMGFNLYKNGTLRVMCRTSVAAPWTDVAYTPTEAQPLYLRMEYTHSNTTVVFKYKGDAEGSWTTLATHNVGADYWSDKMDVSIMADNASADGTGVFSVDFKYLIVENYELDLLLAAEVNAFICTQDTVLYHDNWLYIRTDQDGFQGFPPMDGFGVFYDNKIIKWDLTTEDWVYTVLDMADKKITNLADTVPTDALDAVNVDSWYSLLDSILVGSDGDVMTHTGDILYERT